MLQQVLSLILWIPDRIFLPIEQPPEIIPTVYRIKGSIGRMLMKTRSYKPSGSAGGLLAVASSAGGLLAVV